MPNWVYNHLSVSGKKEEIEKLIADMRRPIPTFVYPEGGYISKDGEWTMEENIVFSFWNVIAPTDLESYFTGDTWYNWNVTNWGTKWDARIEEENMDTYEYPDGTYSVSYNFETAWGQPQEVFVALTEKYPTLSFHIEWEEEQGWGGRATGESGAFTVEETWDIPASHADYVARDNEYSCICADSGMPSEELYEDCPRREEVVPTELAVKLFEEATTKI